jgi:hypothetical protein
MKILDCKGSGIERGRVHGEEARSLIVDAIGKWTDFTMSALSRRTTIDAYAEELLSRTSLMSRIQESTPDLASEVRGIAEGSDVSFNLIAAYNLMDEQWWYDMGRQQEEPGCSTLAKKLATGVVLAQHMDLPSFMDGSQIVLRIDNGENENLVLSSAGMIGLTGASSAGFGVCVNTLLMLNHDPAGLPVSYALRHALAASDAQEAVARLRKTSHASGQHYAVADNQEVVSMECSAAGAVRLPTAGYSLHTNHPLASSDIEPELNALLEQRGRISFSKERLAVLENSIDAIENTEDVVGLLSSCELAICVKPTEHRSSQTFASVAYEFGRRPVAHFALGLPGNSEWNEIPFIRS